MLFSCKYSFLHVQGSKYTKQYAQMFSCTKMCTYETFFKLTVELGQSSSLLSTLLHKKRHGLKRLAGVLMKGRRILRRAL